MQQTNNGVLPQELSNEDQIQEDLSRTMLETDESAWEEEENPEDIYWLSRLQAQLFAARFGTGIGPLCSCCAAKRPDPSELDGVKPGTMVKVAHKTDVVTERLLVRVTRVKGNRYRGILHCACFFDPMLAPGDGYSFNRKDIVEVLADL